MNFASEIDKLESFNAFIENYKGQNIEDKHIIAINDLKEMLELIKRLMADEGIDYKFDVDKKLLEVTDHNYIDVIYTYITMVKDAFATYELKRNSNLNE